MKSLIFLTVFVLSIASGLAQIKCENGPQPENDRDSKMNRMIEGGNDYYYCYRVRSKGKGTSHIIEKYSRNDMNLIFSKEITVDGAENSKIEDIYFLNNKLYVFRTKYLKEEGEKKLMYQTVSENGEVSGDFVELTSAPSTHYQLIEFETQLNPSRTKLLVKASYKINKDAEYKTDFYAYDCKEMGFLWKKSVDRKLRSYDDDAGKALVGWLTGLNIDIADLGYTGMFFDDNDAIYYGYTAENASEGKNKDKKFRLMLETFQPDDNEVNSVELSFNEDYIVKDLAFHKVGPDKLIVCGFFKDVIERTGRDYFDCGVFAFTVEVKSFSLVDSKVQVFDEKFLSLLSTNKKGARYRRFKMDDMFSIGDDIYFVGQQYEERMICNNSGYVRTCNWVYKYMDAIVVKLDSKGDFDWIVNVPMRTAITVSSPHIFKQYTSTRSESKMYFMYNDHPKNMKIYENNNYNPDKLGVTSGIHGSNFVYTSIDMSNGTLNRGLIFVNDTYCFAPVQERNPQFYPPDDAVNFVKDSPEELIIYTEDRGKDRFSRLILQ